MSKQIITVSREFGSGGRTVGKRVAELLGVPYYDKELVKQVAVATGFETCSPMPLRAWAAATP